MSSSKYVCNQSFSPILSLLTSKMIKLNLSRKVRQLEFRVIADGNFVLVRENGRVMQMTADIFKNRYEDHQCSYKMKSVSFSNRFRVVVAFEKKKPADFRSEGFIQLVTQMFKVGAYSLSKTSDTAGGDPLVLGWLLNFMALVMDLSDPFFYGLRRLISMLVRLVGLCAQVVGSYRQFWSEGFDNLDYKIEDLVMVASLFKMPASILNKIQVFTTLTGRKFTDGNLILDAVHIVSELVVSIIEFFMPKDKSGKLAYILEGVKNAFGFVEVNRLVKRLAHVMTTFSKNEQKLLDPLFRMEAIDLYDRIKRCPSFDEYINHPVRRTIANTMNSFVKNVYTMAKMYGNTSRQEPVCIIFEGEAGTGKSRLMNKVTELLEVMNLSVYTHSVPSINAGKDFYDDYVNQDVFVMDDIGQQGKSQWRTIINFVSPVAYPLDCAAAEKKNTKFFNSKLILGTTNKLMTLGGFTSADCVSEPSALYRRCHVIKCGRENIYDLQYFKYDYSKTDKWVHGKTDVFANCTYPIRIKTDKESEALAFMHDVIRELLDLQESLNTNNKVNKSVLRSVVEDYDLRKSQRVLGRFTSQGVHPFHYVECLMREVKEIFLSKLEVASESIANSDLFSRGNLTKGLGVALGFFFISYMVYKMLYSEEKEDPSKITNQIKKWRELNVKLPSRFVSQGKVKLGTQSSFRFFQIFYDHDGLEYETFCQGVVSGDKILLPGHVTGKNMKVNIFQTWEHFENGHFEHNLIPLEVIREYKSLDIAIVRMTHISMAPYRLAKVIFPKEIRNLSAKMHFINCDLDLSMLYGNNVKMNADSFTVYNHRQELVFGSDSGLLYEYSSPGLCGSLIVDEQLGFVGMHVAGNGEQGFSVIPSDVVRSEIAECMLSSGEPNYQYRENVTANFSGSRLEYDTLTINNVPQESHFVKTGLHRDVCNDVKDLMAEYRVEPKAPAELNKYGRKTVVTLAAKSFIPMKKIPQDEIDFAKECLRSMMIPYGEMSDKETAFGNGEDIVAIKKDSSNGYGYSSRKEDYLDYENKVIRDNFQQVLSNFKERCRSGENLCEDFLARESLKDEMRPVGKDPRTFRIMPLHHIFLVKKYIGNLFKHIRASMWDNGIAIGMNPYTEWKKLYAKLRSGKAFALDFAKWDGSCHAQIQDAVSEVMLEFYQGVEADVFEKLLHSMVRGFTLVKDELYSTTHSLPSGAWITALFNSFINRMLTAICLYREMKTDGRRATVEDFNQLIDFVLGDDKICATPPHLEKYFNAKTLESLARSIGMTATDCHKKPIDRAFYPLEDCTFLKREFKVHPVLGIVGALDINTLITTVQWYDSSRVYEEVMRGKAVAVQIEGYLHSQRISERFSRLFESINIGSKLSESRILAIMEDGDAAYKQVMVGLGKFVQY